jgi:hypothetical protein
MHLSKPNVYQTLVLVRRYSGAGSCSCPAIGSARSREMPIDTFVQLVSLHSSGLIAIVRQSIPFCGGKNSDSQADADLMVIAERELGAFIGAVTELFGVEQAKLAADDWVDELELMDILPGSTGRDWGSVTVAASARLARRLNTEVSGQAPRVASTDTKVSPIPSCNCFDPTGLA